MADQKFDECVVGSDVLHIIDKEAMRDKNIDELNLLVYKKTQLFHSTVVKHG
jgi:hypothetical protein